MNSNNSTNFSKMDDSNQEKPYHRPVPKSEYPRIEVIEPTNWEPYKSTQAITIALERFSEVPDLSRVELTTFIRYFVWDRRTQAYKYRHGGYLMRKNDLRYVILCTSPYAHNREAKRWSVQRSIDDHPTIFYRLMTNDEYEADKARSDTSRLSAKYQAELQRLELETDKLRSHIF